ncbi:MAG: HEAT repeat domain-containing protein [Planctomycetota bacterium]
MTLTARRSPAAAAPRPGSTLVPLATLAGLATLAALSAVCRPATLRAADVPPDVEQALEAVEAAAPPSTAGAEVWGTWIHARAAAKKELLGAGDQAVAPIVAWIRNQLGLDRGGQDVVQGRGEVLHTFYSILATLDPHRAGALFLEIAKLRADHPYQEERAWALWALGGMTFQPFLGDAPEPDTATLQAAAQQADAWWKIHGAQPWTQWREDAIARAHDEMEGNEPDAALAGATFLFSQNLVDDTVLKALRSLISGEGRTWDSLHNYQRARAISLAVRLRRVDFEPLFQAAAMSADATVAQAGVAALGAVGTPASLSLLVQIAADPDPDRAADGLLAGTALTGAWQATADEFKLWAAAHAKEKQEDWWLRGLPDLVDRAAKGDATAVSILYTRVRRPMPPVSLDDLRYPQFGPQIETWPVWYARVKDLLAWDSQYGQVVLDRAPAAPAAPNAKPSGATPNTPSTPSTPAAGASAPPAEFAPFAPAAPAPTPAPAPAPASTPAPTPAPQP